MTEASAGERKELSHALWWVSRWITGSMDDPDWDWPEAETMGVTRAFETVQAAIGNGRSVGRQIWRYVCVSEAEAARIEREMTLLPHEAPFQSFTTSKAIAEDIGADLCRQGEVHVMVCAEVPDGDVMFGLADLKGDRRANETLLSLGDWFHQDEVMVRVAGPLPILAVKRLDLDASLDPEDDYEAMTGRRL